MSQYLIIHHTEKENFTSSGKVLSFKWRNWSGENVVFSSIQVKIEVIKMSVLHAKKTSAQYFAKTGK